MIYTPMTKKAMGIAFKAHDGQLDKAGLPYVNHPLHLAEQMDTEEECCVALLHDVVEDTDWTLDDLRREGFSDEVIEGVDLMTHDPQVNYFDYVRQLAPNPIARKVKLADLDHNSDLSRLDEVTPYHLEKLGKYKEAKRILIGE